MSLFLLFIFNNRFNYANVLSDWLDSLIVSDCLPDLNCILDLGIDLSVASTLFWQMSLRWTSLEGKKKKTQSKQERETTLLSKQPKRYRDKTMPLCSESTALGR